MYRGTYPLFHPQASAKVTYKVMLWFLPRNLGTTGHEEKIKLTLSVKKAYTNAFGRPRAAEAEARLSQHQRL